MNIYLARHPEIFMAEKELHYFSGDVLFGPRLVERDLAWYLNLFTKAGEKKLLGEASAFYPSSSCAADRIKEFEPNAKILMHVRDPSELILSYHSDAQYRSWENIEDIEQALQAEAQRRQGRSIPVGCPVPRLLYYSDIARVSAQIGRFFAVFGRENVLVNVFDDLEANPAAVYKTTLAFLGADPTFTTTFENFNSNKINRSSLLRRYTSNPRVKQVADVVFSRPIREALGEWLRRLNTRYVPRAANPAVMAWLKHEFAGAVEQISNLLGRDLTAWSR